MTVNTLKQNKHKLFITYSHCCKFVNSRKMSKECLINIKIIKKIDFKVILRCTNDAMDPSNSKIIKKYKNLRNCIRLFFFIAFESERVFNKQITIDSQK